MRTDKERIEMMHQRAAEIKTETRQKQVRVIQAVSVAGCFAAVIALALLMPGISGSLTSDVMGHSMQASMFANSSMLGYIVIGILAFALGMAVTVFCFRLRKWQREKDKKDMQW